jgi:hypothetical protein
MKDYDNEHGTYCITTIGSMCALNLLIDIIKGCLVDLNSPKKYIAFSYVWGNFKSCQTLQRSVEQLGRPDTLFDEELYREMPRMIRNAIRLTNLLGQLYLRVDALYIIQDGPDKQVQLDRMDSNMRA